MDLSAVVLDFFPWSSWDTHASFQADLFLVAGECMDRTSPSIPTSTCAKLALALAIPSCLRSWERDIVSILHAVRSSSTLFFVVVFSTLSLLVCFDLVVLGS